MTAKIQKPYFALKYFGKWLIVLCEVLIKHFHVIYSCSLLKQAINADFRVNTRVLVSIWEVL